jgi:hypothetical protein
MSNKCHRTLKTTTTAPALLTGSMCASAKVLCLLLHTASCCCLTGLYAAQGDHRRLTGSCAALMGTAIHCRLLPHCTRISSALPSVCCCPKLISMQHAAAAAAAAAALRLTCWLVRSRWRHARPSQTPTQPSQSHQSAENHHTLVIRRLRTRSSTLRHPQAAYTVQPLHCCPGWLIHYCKLSVCLPVCLSVYLYVYLSQCLWA